MAVWKRQQYSSQCNIGCGRVEATAVEQTVAVNVDVSVKAYFLQAIVVVKARLVMGQGAVAVKASGADAVAV